MWLTKALLDKSGCSAVMLAKLWKPQEGQASGGSHSTAHKVLSVWLHVSPWKSTSIFYIQSMIQIKSLYKTIPGYQEDNKSDPLSLDSEEKDNNKSNSLLLTQEEVLKYLGMRRMKKQLHFLLIQKDMRPFLDCHSGAVQCWTWSTCVILTVCGRVRCWQWGRSSMLRLWR